MIKNKYCFYLFLSCALLIFRTAPAHDVVVHQNITLNAASSAQEYSTSYCDFKNMVASDNFKLPVYWMVQGSAHEDDKDAPGDAGGKRSLNHFYDPVHKIGLTDRPFNPPLPLGRDSFFWATTTNAPGLDIGFPVNNEGTFNIWSWKNTRGYEWLGLTSSSQSVRSTNLSQLFRGLGQVLHLLEDTSQPQHVRNEQHYRIVCVLVSFSASLL